MWKCTYCGSMDVHTIDSARFDPNNDDAFVDCCETSDSFDWCNTCDSETSFDEIEPPDDPWGHAYGDPMYWVPPVDDEYWEVRNDAGEGYEFWTADDEKIYWAKRLA
jgi:hypothetical protein